jgi:multisubunit Na+/H+ antiporter MnhE subunit
MTRRIERRAGAARAWGAWWIVSAALWLALVDRVQLDELAVGAVVAACAATGAVLVRSQRTVLLAPRAGWLAPAWRPVLGLVADLAPLARALWRRGILRRAERGRLVEVPFAAFGEDGRQTAYRVLTEALGSLAPNTVVVDADEERRVLVVHQLVATDDVRRRACPLAGEPPP